MGYDITKFRDKKKYKKRFAYIDYFLYVCINYKYI